MPSLVTALAVSAAAPMVPKASVPPFSRSTTPEPLAAVISVSLATALALPLTVRAATVASLALTTLLSVWRWW